MLPAGAGSTGKFGHVPPGPATGDASGHAGPGRDVALHGAGGRVWRRLARWRGCTLVRHMCDGRDGFRGRRLRLPRNSRLQFCALRSRLSATSLIGFRSGHGGPRAAAERGGRRESGRDRHHRIGGVAASVERHGRNGGADCRRSRGSRSSVGRDGRRGGSRHEGGRCHGGSAGDRQDRVGGRTFRMRGLRDRRRRTLDRRKGNSSSISLRMRLSRWPFEVPPRTTATMCLASRATDATRL